MCRALCPALGAWRRTWHGTLPRRRFVSDYKGEQYITWWFQYHVANVKTGARAHTHTHERLLTRSKEPLLKERGLLSLFSTRWRTAMRMRRERCYELSCKRSEKQPAWDSWGRLGKSFYHSRPLFSRCAIPHLSGKSGGTFLPRREGGRTGCPLRPLPSLSSLELRVGTAHGAILLPLSPKEMQCWKPDPVFWHTEPCTVMASPGSLRL